MSRHDHTPIPWVATEIPHTAQDADGVFFIDEAKGISVISIRSTYMKEWPEIAPAALRTTAFIANMTGTSDEDKANAAFIVKAVNSHDALVSALERIERWFGEFPETGQFWPNPDGSDSDRPMSYSAAYGSNGERDFMREVARVALSQAKSEEE